MSPFVCNFRVLFILIQTGVTAEHFENLEGTLVKMWGCSAVIVCELNIYVRNVGLVVNTAAWRYESTVFASHP